MENNTMKNTYFVHWRSTSVITDNIDVVLAIFNMAKDDLSSFELHTTNSMISGDYLQYLVESVEPEELEEEILKIKN